MINIHFQLNCEFVSYCEGCGYAKCQDCQACESLDECKILDALDHQETIKKAIGDRQLPNSVYEPVLPLRLLLTKW